MQAAVGCAQLVWLFAGNLIKHPCFDEMRASGSGYRVVGTLENIDRIMWDTFWIGVYPGMNQAMLEYMAEQIKKFAEVKQKDA